MTERKEKPIVLGICGSVRNGSWNGKLLRAAAHHLPENVEYREVQLDGLPFYTPEREADIPESVKSLLAEVNAASGVLIASPEYNFTIPAALKCALEWLSRPTIGTPLAGKPVAIMGATPGNYGTARMQIHLRDILFAVDADPIRRPEVLLTQCMNKFDANGTLSDTVADGLIKQLIDAFAKRLS